MRSPKDYIARHREMKRVPKAWSAARYYYYHPALAHHGQEVQMLTVAQLRDMVDYIDARQKIAVEDGTVYVMHPETLEVLGKLRPHCMKFLAGHLKLAEVCGDQRAIEVGQHLRKETVPAWW